MVKHENIPPLIIPTRYFSIDLNAITPIIKPLPAIAAPVSTYHNNIKKDVVLLKAIISGALNELKELLGDAVTLVIETIEKYINCFFVQAQLLRCCV
jgi:hypothetical protein